MEIIRMSWTAIRAIDFERSVLFIPMAPLEEHGPHLPIGTDGFLAETAARLAAERLSGHFGLTPYLYPLVWLGSAVETHDFPGTVSTTPLVMTHVAVQILKAASSWGFRYAVFVSPHNSPLHLATLHAAIQIVQGRYPIKVAEPLAWWMWDLLREPSDSEAEGIPLDLHAGASETGMMMALAPELVNLDLAQSLPPVSIDLTAPGTWQDKGAVDGYVGDPASASLLAGREALESFSRYADAAADLLNGMRRFPPRFIAAMVERLAEDHNRWFSDSL
ncbi:MAG: creatininase family protein [Solirubrobacterales bacterium]